MFEEIVVIKTYSLVWTENSFVPEWTAVGGSQWCCIIAFNNAVCRLLWANVAEHLSLMTNDVLAGGADLPGEIFHWIEVTIGSDETIVLTSTRKIDSFLVHLDNYLRAQAVIVPLGSEHPPRSVCLASLRPSAPRSSLVNDGTTSRVDIQASTLLWRCQFSLRWIEDFSRDDIIHRLPILRIVWLFVNASCASHCCTVTERRRSAHAVYTPWVLTARLPVFHTIFPAVWTMSTLYKSLFTKLVVAKKRKQHTLHINTVKSNKTKKYSEQVCHCVVVCGNTIADTSLLC